VDWKTIGAVIESHDDGTGTVPWVGVVRAARLDLAPQVIAAVVDHHIMLANYACDRDRAAPSMNRASALFRRTPPPGSSQPLDPIALLLLLGPPEIALIESHLLPHAVLAAATRTRHVAVLAPAGDVEHVWKDKLSHVDPRLLDDPLFNGMPVTLPPDDQSVRPVLALPDAKWPATPRAFVLRDRLVVVEHSHGLSFARGERLPARKRHVRATTPSGIMCSPTDQREGGSQMLRSPEELDPTFTKAFNAGDTETIAALYDPSAVFVLPGGEVIEGLESIGQSMKEFLTLQPRIDLQTQSVLRSGDTALVHSTWTLAGTGPDGSAVEMAGNSRVVLRQQGDGPWRVVIDDPGWIAG
jgi:uncharacterized protein (TIGR02246 family)